MPRSPASKRVRKSTRFLSAVEKRVLQHSGNEIPEIDENYDEEGNNIKLLHDDLPKSQKRSRKTNTHPSGRKEAIYAQAKKDAKELATSSVNILKEAQEKLKEMYDQELQFQKLDQDCHLPLRAQEDVFDKLIGSYSPLCQELVSRRQEQMSEVSQMLNKNGPVRQEALKEMSKKARHQLEQAKLREKEVTDAAELIKRVKHMLRI